MRNLLISSALTALFVTSPLLAKEATQLDAMKVARKVAAKRLGPKHEKIEITGEVKEDDITFVLWYSDMPSSYAEVEKDTTAVVAYAKKVWLEEGLDVPQFIFSVTCRSYKDEGGGQIRTMGTAYWHGQDITFKKR
jgi:acid phosphatase family membrane protein YuiD